VVALGAGALVVGVLVTAVLAEEQLVKSRNIMM
jgi:hypothetical protein